MDIAKDAQQASIEDWEYDDSPIQMTWLSPR